MSNNPDPVAQAILDRIKNAHAKKAEIATDAKERSKSKVSKDKEESLKLTNSQEAKANLIRPQVEIGFFALIWTNTDQIFVMKEKYARNLPTVPQLLRERFLGKNPIFIPVNIIKIEIFKSLKNLEKEKKEWEKERAEKWEAQFKLQNKILKKK